MTVRATLDSISRRWADCILFKVDCNWAESCLWRHRVLKFRWFPWIIWRHRQLWNRFPGDRLIVSWCCFRLFFVIFWALYDGYLDKKWSYPRQEENVKIPDKIMFVKGYLFTPLKFCLLQRYAELPISAENILRLMAEFWSLVQAVAHLVVWKEILMSESFFYLSLVSRDLYWMQLTIVCFLSVSDAVAA